MINLTTKRGAGGALAILGVVGSATVAAAAVVGLDTAAPMAVAHSQDVFPEPLVTIGGASAEAEGYDSTFEFVRVRYDAGRSFSFRRGEPEWAHDYDRADREILAVLNEVTNMKPRLDGFRVLNMDDPRIFSFPAIYMVEIGFWNPRREEAQALRDYLLKGGFMIVDDFRGRQLGNLYRIMNQVMPELEVQEVPDDHPIFDSFFRIEKPRELPTHPVYGPMQPVYLGLFEDNDPTGRLMAIFNYDNDIAEWWETFSYGYYPIDLSNEAFKFGVNYVVYAHIN